MRNPFQDVEQHRQLGIGIGHSDLERTKQLSRYELELSRAERAQWYSDRGCLECAVTDRN